MKKTIRINISGIVFNIDEDAYDKLQHYLNSITKQFINTNEGNEIIADVESRVAELFQEKIGDRKEVINLSDIEYIIEIMGKPEDFEEPEDGGDESVESEIQSKRGTRRIYRDPDNRVLGGLSAGLAAYFGIDPIIVRLIFVLMTFFYGTSILIYILLWIVIPEAKTRSQKLEMRGQDINISNIESSIKSEFKQVKSNFNNWQKRQNYDRLRSNTGDVINTFWKLFGVAFKIFAILIGAFFLIIGIGLLGAMTGLFFFDNTILSPMSWNNVTFSLSDFTSLFTDSFNARVLMITSYLLILIPVLTLIYFGVRFIFKIKTKNRYIAVYAGALWLVSLFVLIVSSVKIAYGMRASQDITQSYPIENKSTDTLYLELFKDEMVDEWNDHKAQFGNVFVEFEDEKGLILSGRPDFSIEKSSGSQMELLVVKRSKGINNQDAIKNLKNLQYEWQQNDSVLYFRSEFQINGEKKIRNQALDIVLKMPVGKVVYLGENMDYFCSYFENVNDYSCDEMIGHYWIMTESGLKLIGEPELHNISFDEHVDNQNNPDTLKGNLKNEIEEMKAELDSM